MNDLRTIEASQTLLINQQSKKLIAEKKTIYKFGFGESPFMPPDFVLESFRKNVHRKDYGHVQGDLPLRKAVSKFYKEANGINISEENVFVAPGSKILIFSVLASFTKADVFIPKPSWVSYAPQAKLAGHNLIPVETSYDLKWRVTPEAVEQSLKKKKHQSSILIINYPGNPDGLSYSENEIRALSAVATENDILVISDEIYALLHHSDSHCSFTNYHNKTVTTTGLSKWCGAGGWRLGVALLSDELGEEFKEAMIGVASETYSCAPTPVQMAALEAFGSYDRVKPYLNSQINILKQLGAYCHSKLSETKIKIHLPQGAFYMLPDFSDHREKLASKNISTSGLLCKKLLEDTGVVLLPGSAFGLEPNYLAARLAYVDFDDPLKKTDFNLHRDCTRVVEGIEKMCNWITAL
ncbi:MAG: pyridoxal phosphate-dependent aminotransferase [Flammeovirgaceae bacterium]|nr:pyridoxal phosphate-dependent aminotransferase [Flammeovirgaceae bacterium]